MDTEFAVVKWFSEDIKSIKKDWSDGKCVEFLIEYQDIIKDRMIEQGWDVIEQLIREEDDSYESVQHDEKKVY